MWVKLTRCQVLDQTVPNPEDNARTLACFRDEDAEPPPRSHVDARLVVRIQVHGHDVAAVIRENVHLRVPIVKFWKIGTIHKQNFSY